MDLFDDDKRLALKPVANFNTLLEQAFADGECRCVRCQGNGGAQGGYSQAHTFQVEGRPLARQFLQTAQGDVQGVLEKAYKAFYKATLPAIDEASLGELQAMATQPNVARVKLLLEVSGLLGSAPRHPEAAPPELLDFDAEFEGGLDSTWSEPA